MQGRTYKLALQPKNPNSSSFRKSKLENNQTQMAESNESSSNNKDADPSIMLSFVVDWNNRGVAHFEDGGFPQAMALFRDALQCATTGDNAPTSTSTSRSSSTHEIRRMSAIQVTNSCTPVFKASIKQDGNKDIDDFKHSQAIEVVATPNAYSDDPLTNQVILSAMIIWNLALIYHVKSDNQTERLLKAQSLYQSSWRLVQHVLEQGSKGNPVVDLFAQALLNNLGECSHKLQDYAQTRFWSEKLLKFAHSIPSSPSSYEDPAIATILQKQSYQFVLSATMRMQPPSYLASAA
jgi:tetratricopeptide (TPR) repeat protein